MHSLCQVSCVDSYHSSGKPLRNQRRIKHHLQFGHFGTGGVTLGGPDMDEVGWNIVLVVSWLDSFKIKHQTSNIKHQTSNSKHQIPTHQIHHTPHTTPHIKHQTNDVLGIQTRFQHDPCLWTVGSNSDGYNQQQHPHNVPSASRVSTNTRVSALMSKVVITWCRFLFFLEIFSIVPRSKCKHNLRYLAREATPPKVMTAKEAGTSRKKSV